MFTRKSVLDLVEYDRTIRTKCTDADLLEYPIDFDTNVLIETKDESDVFPYVDYSLHVNERINNEVDKFTRTFYKLFPIFRDIDFSNILIAGGCISSILSGDTYVKDIDVFFYGLTPSQCTEKLKRITGMYFKDTHFVKNRYVITYHYKIKEYQYTPIQFIFRCYKSISEILHGFDIGASAIGFDGRRLLTTRIGHAAIKHGFNIVDVTKLSASYHYRLVKYNKRGFGIILPNLNPAMIDRKQKWLNVGKIKIMVKQSPPNENLIGTYCDVTDFVWQKEISDYLDDEENDVHKPVMHQNLNILSKGTVEKYIFAGKGDDFDGKLNDAEIDKIKEIYTLFMENLYKQRNNSINIGRFKKLNPNTTVTTLVKILEANDKDTFDNLVKMQLLDLEIKMRSVEFKIEWRTENPGGQDMVTGSFHHTPMTTKEWYGELYIDV